MRRDTCVKDWGGIRSLQGLEDSGNLPSKDPLYKIGSLYVLGVWSRERCLCRGRGLCHSSSREISTASPK